MNVHLETKTEYVHNSTIFHSPKVKYYAFRPYLSLEKSLLSRSFTPKVADANWVGNNFNVNDFLLIAKFCLAYMLSTLLYFLWTASSPKSTGFLVIEMPVIMRHGLE